MTFAYMHRGSDEVFEINLSRDSDYHTQINNKLIPFASCNTTAAVMALKAAGIMFDYPVGMQPEDYFTQLMLGDEAKKLMRELYPMAESRGMIPQNFSGCLVWGINKIVGRKVDRFTMQGSLQQMIWEINQGHPIIMSGRFTKSGHFVCLVGFRTLQHKSDFKAQESVDINAVDYVIVDDPYGNWYTDYKNHKGNNIKFDLQKYHDLTNAPNIDRHKWLHIISEVI
jgi:hypothetical protein